MLAKPLLKPHIQWETDRPRHSMGERHGHWAIVRIILRQRRRLFYLTFAFFTLSALFYLSKTLGHPRQIPSLRYSLNSENPSTTSPSPSMIAFWSDLTAALFAAEPNVAQIEPQRQLLRADFDPENPDHQLDFDNVALPQEQLDSLKSKHAEFLESLARLGPLLPFRKNRRGIVMTANGNYLGVAITSLLMLRRAGSKLPVEVFLSSANEHVRQQCDNALSRLNARCVNMDNFLRRVPASTPANATAEAVLSLSRYQFKPFALLFSTFQSVLFLDADAFPIHNPDRLLRAEPFLGHGLVTWPDFWLPTVSPLFWEVSGMGTRLPPQPVSIDSRATESGIMLVDKSRHAKTLILAAYYSLYGPKAYYPLHSQSAWGEGDKESFRLAATVLGRPVWHVLEPPRMITEDALNDGSGIRQADPEEDWAKWLRRREETKRKRKAHEKGWRMNLRDGDEEEKRQRQEARRGQGDEPQPQTQGSVKEQTSARWLFAHTNRVKIDSRRLNASVGHMIYRKVDDKYSRLWGHNSAPIIEDAGFDLEKAIWEEILRADCSKTYLEECEKLQDYYNSVFLS